jgi:hypothetical protein
MVTSEERMKILKMISEDKISADEGAKLLAALSHRSEKPPMPRRKLANQMLRVRVTDMSSGRAKVNVNLPMRLVDAGLNIAAQFTPEMQNEQMILAVKEALAENVMGKIVEVIDEDDGEHIEIFIE